jgi:hypothetical protein
MNLSMPPVNAAVKEAYEAYRLGNGITDAQLESLLQAIRDALPFLSSSPAFALVYREARMDQEALEGFQYARKEQRR